jgi:signal transduction histidine kinase
MGNTQSTIEPLLLRQRRIATAVILAAVVLTAVATGLAIYQARMLSARVMNQVELRAQQTADRVGVEAQQRIAMVLGEVLRRARERTDSAQAALPEWVRGALVHRRGESRLIEATPELRDALPLIERHIRERPTTALGLSSPTGTELYFEQVGGQPLVLALSDSPDIDFRPLTAAVLVDSAPLAKELLKPVIEADEALELAPAGRSTAGWHVQLPGALRHWSIAPAERFVIEQRRALMAQTFAYVGLTTLALVGLAAAMRVLIRLARREMALAEMKSNFVADVSHELKTPLALIRLYAETLQSGRVPTDEKRNEYYNVIMRESTRLTNLINNILDFARIESGRKEYAMQPVDVGRVVREVYEMFRPQLEDAKFEHEIAVSPDLPEVAADRDAVSQILVNLINNAIKYSADDKYLLVETVADVRRGRRGVLISVHDRGIGIRPADRVMDTEGFFRANDPQVRQRGGTGLGLALVKRMVETHGGSVDVESRLVKGTTFRVFLPEWNRGEEAASRMANAE